MATRRTPLQLSPTPTLAELFGRNLWRSRRRADLSQQELADLVGLSRNAIYTLELGQRLPRLDSVLRLAAGVNVSTRVLLAGMQWRPGYCVYIEGEFDIEHPAVRLQRSLRG
jgi:transcriptional regulator with XRE-family HTH domain